MNSRTECPESGAPLSRPSAERGSALLISLMVMVILTLLGIAYLLMAETESQIALNQRNAGQVLYTAESGARAAVEWFQSPIGGFSLPATGDIDRTLRQLDLDDDGIWETTADGSAGQEYYRQTTNLLFQKPYRSAIEDTFLGSEDGPDIRITDPTYLDALNAALLGTGAGTPADPDPEATFGRITQIDIYAPPILVVNGNRTRHGVATLKVTAQKLRTVGGVDRVLAERTVKAVVNEINYPSADSPLQACSNGAWGGNFSVHWGPVITGTTGDFSITPAAGLLNLKMPSGMPYATTSSTVYFASAADFTNWVALNPAVTFDDPWFKVVVGETILDIDNQCLPGTDPQPCGSAPLAAGYDGATNHSNIFQLQSTLANCPNFDYTLFKTIAQRGGAGMYYYSYNPATEKFKEGGLGAEVTFKQASDGRAGFFFFDTALGTPPEYDAGNNCTNCTAALSYNSSDRWGSGVDAFIYLNATSFETTGAGIIGYTRTLNAPGEPYHDSNGDGSFNTGEPHLDLAYPAGESDPVPVAGVAGARDALGPDISSDNMILHGIMVLNGELTGTGNGKYYGSVVAKKFDTTATIDMWYNERIGLNAWPPPSSPAPKVYVSIWEVDNL